MLFGQKSTTIDPPDFWRLTLSNLVTSQPDLYEKLEEQRFKPVGDCPRKLFARHAVPKSEMSGPLCHVFVENVEDRVHPQLSLYESL